MSRFNGHANYMFPALLTFTRNERIGILRIVFVAVAAACQAVSLSAQSGSAGQVKFVVRTDPKFDMYLNAPSSDSKQWLNSHIWRMMVYSPFFDNKLNWYRNGWAYINLYGVHTDWPIVKEHPEWLLKDQRGNPLYVPYGCANGTCPLFAADASNPQYRAYWISRARELVSRGYQGLWIDDVNLEFRVSDGMGRQTAPIDPSTGTTMTYEAWKEDIATFCEEIRAAFPNTEILHNAIWYAGGPKRDSDPSVARELRAADYINLERGVSDRGLTGGEGEWSLDAFFRYIDRLHAQGKSIIIDNTGSFTEYGLAAYFLISSGNDGVGGHDITPDHWPALLNVDLGAPLGPRSRANGVFRREFERGVVVLNEPRSQPEIAPTCHDCVGLEGQPTSSVRLMSSQGAILLRRGGRSAP